MKIIFLHTLNRSVLVLMATSIGVGGICSEALAAGASSKSAASKPSPAPTLDMAPYTGSGKMPVGLALEKLLPTVSAVYLNSNLSMSKVVSWKVVNGTVGQALDEIFHPLQLEWYLTDNSLVVKRAAIGPEQIITTVASPRGTYSVTEKVTLTADGDVDISVAQNLDLQKIAPLAPIELPTQYWQLKKGETIRSELSKWAKDSGWSLVWQFDKDWVIPSDSEFSGSFDIAAAKVVETLSSNGVLIHANFYSSNKTLVITGPGVTPQ